MKPRKLLERIHAGHTRNIAFADFVRLVEAFGFVNDRTAGSHRLWLHPKARQRLNLQPAGNDAKPYQIKQFLHLMEEYNLQMENRE